MVWLQRSGRRACRLRTSPTAFPSCSSLVISADTALARDPSAPLRPKVSLQGRAQVLDLRAKTEWPVGLGTFSSAGGGNIAWPEPSSTVIVDQNFLINLDRCLSRSAASGWEHLRDAVAWLAACHTLPGFAITECSYGDRGLDQAAELRAAVETWWALAIT